VRVVLVHLAAKGFDENFFAHGGIRISRFGPEQGLVGPLRSEGPGDVRVSQRERTACDRPQLDLSGAIGSGAASAETRKVRSAAAPARFSAASAGLSTQTSWIRPWPSRT